MDINELLSKDAFKNLDAEQLSTIKTFAESIDGKNPSEIMSLFMRNMQGMTKGMPVKGAERDAIVQTIMESLPESDQKKMRAVVKMMEMLG